MAGDERQGKNHVHGKPGREYEYQKKPYGRPYGFLPGLFRKSADQPVRNKIDRVLRILAPGVIFTWRDEQLGLRKSLLVPFRIGIGDNNIRHAIHNQGRTGISGGCFINWQIHGRLDISASKMKFAS